MNANAYIDYTLWFDFYSLIWSSSTGIHIYINKVSWCVMLAACYFVNPADVRRPHVCVCVFAVWTLSFSNKFMQTKLRSIRAINRYYTHACRAATQQHRYGEAIFIFLAASIFNGSYSFKGKVDMIDLSWHNGFRIFHDWLWCCELVWFVYTVTRGCFIRCSIQWLFPPAVCGVHWHEYKHCGGCVFECRIFLLCRGGIFTLFTWKYIFDLHIYRK